MEFAYRAVTLICGSSSQDPLLKNLEEIEIPFPFPCAFDCIRDALASRRSYEVCEIRKLVMKTPFNLANPEEEHPLHEYFAHFVESLQFIVKDVVVIGMPNCPYCQSFSGYPPLPTVNLRW